MIKICQKENKKFAITINNNQIINNNNNLQIMRIKNNQT